MAHKGKMKSQDEDLPPDIKDWSKHQVREWALKLDDVDDGVAEILLQQDINGPSLLLLDTEDFKKIGVTFGPAKLLIHARDEIMKLKKEEATSATNLPRGACKPYPFCKYDDTYRYMESDILDITESGASDSIEPCHEYKAFNNATDESTMTRLTEEVIRFAAACMNSCTNGTIHFGIGDEPNFRHGQVLGVVVKDREAYAIKLNSAIDYFEHKHKQTAHSCIKPPRFVGVLNRNETSSDKWVIEVDIVPDSTMCEENIYHTFNMDTKKAKKKAKVKETATAETRPSKQFFVRDGGSSRDLLAPNTSAKPMEEYNQFIAGQAQRAQRRKEAQEKHLNVIKSSTQGSRLSQMITGGSSSLDKSHFEQYVIVTNKSHPIHFESLGFLVELNPIAVLDFDPESAKDGLQCHFEQLSTVNVHLPEQYKITEGVEDIANKLKLTRTTSWVFCNGGIQGEAPSDIDEWLMDKGSSVRDVISFLCRKDVLPNKRFLVIFLLWSTVSKNMDPLVETFSTFWQELRGTEQILCICDNEKAFTSWKNLVDARCGIDIARRCIYELGFTEVNGTVLSLLSKNRRSSRFLPCGGGSNVLLEKKVERDLKTLEVLCVNQCEGGNEDKMVIEENFYKGGQVSWWNFYFSEQPGSTPFIKRDTFDFIKDTVIPDLCSLGKACVSFNLMHVPGCGGTTLAMHTLWTLRHKFRCAVLRDSNADFAEVAGQVVKLLMYDHEEQLPRVPVLLMIDHFDDKEKVFDLQRAIDEECTKKNIQSKSAQVILLNCMTSESSEQTNQTEETVFIGNNLSETEQKLFEEKLRDIEKKHKDADTFYGFMILKNNPSLNPEYVQGVARKTLKSFNMNQKHAQLLAVLVLLNVYCKRASLSVSLCEDFLGLQPKPVCGTIKVEEGFGKFSTFIATCSVEGKVVFKAVKMIHSRIASQCLQELTTTHNVNKAEITDLLLTTDQLYESTQGKDKLLQDVRHILVKRDYSEEESKFSPLIQHIARETPGLEEMVLQNASKRFAKDAVVSQLLARYYYLKKTDFSEAQVWALRARDLSKDSSYFADTSAQVIKHELKNAIANHKEEPVSSEKLKIFLKIAQSAIEAFKETQNLAKKESSQGVRSFNTAGCLGEIQVGVLVIKVLEKTPVFSHDNVRHDIMSEVLSGVVKLQAVETNDKRRNKHTQYYKILQQFEDVLCTLRYRMKMNFDFLDTFYVNLGSTAGMKDSREQRFLNELIRCFKEYAKLFCKTDSAALLRNKTMNNRLELHEARQYLERQKADTYSGILNFLSDDISPEIMRKIAKLSALVCAPKHQPTVKEKINFIYVNVVLSCIKLASPHIKLYQNLISLLGQVLCEQIPLGEILPLQFIAVVLLWPQQHCPEMVLSKSLGKHISQMRTSYYMVMKEVYKGKWPIVHFILGKKQGYERLVHLEEIKRCIRGGQEDFTVMWENGKIWKEKKVEECLCRVTGQVNNKLILADTYIPGLKLEIAPMFQSQLSGYAQESEVSFFIGFSIKGPVALDIK
ncbi:sterile alpha motif domain-containing protein 9-like isoform X1 [Anarrhichthys ocellatus]|uniref:sterile alpha motif domain-containing protein 9-like isoform X1 n=2 Tax=Anarrhichthys ocellatus TaxID=433405 RepID=UPI0012ED831C|nr:sterile alpha motif domain-containing protein 9-like isoform X1 [Anarrhichthys ocellatus]